MNLDNYDKIEHDDGRIELIPKKKDKWDFEDKSYFIVTASLELCLRECDNFYKRSHAKAFNQWPTKELAEKAAKMMRFSNALITARLMVEPDWEPDWDNESQEKCFLHKRGVAIWRTIDELTPAFSSREKALKARELLKKWGVI